MRKVVQRERALPLAFENPIQRPKQGAGRHERATDNK